MANTLKTYALKDVHAVINGYLISGAGVDGFVTLEPMEARGQLDSGISGDAVYSKIAGEHWKLTITLLQQCDALRLLHQIYLTQRTADTAIVPLNFLLTDSINGDYCSCSHPVFLEEPAMNKNKTAEGSSKFVIGLPNAVVRWS